MFFLHKEEVSQSKHEALSHIRFGNNSLVKQFERDIELTSLAIVQSGTIRVRQRRTKQIFIIFIRKQK